MFIETNILKTVQPFAENNGIREHLNGVSFDYDKDNRILTIVATNAQILLKHEIKITDDNDHEFCSNNFVKDNGVIIKIPKTITSCKDFQLEIKRIGDNSFAIGSDLCEIVDLTYPNYKVVIPTKDLEPATKFALFNIEWLTVATKALKCVKGKNWHGILSERPKVQFNPNETPAEIALCPHVWEMENLINNSTKTTVVIMPMRE